MTDTIVYNPSFKIHKPSLKDHTKGTVSQWEWNPRDGGSFWLVIAKQQNKKSEKGNPLFDWENKSQMRLDFPDLSDILAVFSGKKSCLGKEEGDKGTGLFHKNQKGNTILKLYKYPGRHNAFVMEYSAKAEKSVFRATQIITLQESTILETIIREVIWRLFELTGRKK